MTGLPRCNRHKTGYRQTGTRRILGACRGKPIAVVDELAIDALARTGDYRPTDAGALLMNRPPAVGELDPVNDSRLTRMPCRWPTGTLPNPLERCARTRRTTTRGRPPLRNRP